MNFIKYFLMTKEDRAAAKLCGHAVVKINGVKITIRRLAPVHFSDVKDMVPVSNVTTNSDKTGNLSEKDTSKYIKDSTDVFRKVIEKGVVSPNVDTFLDELIKSPNQEFLSLFNAIHFHALGLLKKKLLSRYGLTKHLRLIFT